MSVSSVSTGALPQLATPPQLGALPQPAASPAPPAQPGAQSAGSGLPGTPSSGGLDLAALLGGLSGPAPQGPGASVGAPDLSATPQPPAPPTTGPAYPDAPPQFGHTLDVQA